jgi:hypothetical protein
MAVDKFRTHSTLEGPASEGFAIVNDADFPFVSRKIYVGGAGDIVVRMAKSQTNLTFKGVPVGTVLELRADKVVAAGTTATFLVGLY